MVSLTMSSTKLSTSVILFWRRPRRTRLTTMFPPPASAPAMQALFVQISLIAIIIAIFISMHRFLHYHLSWYSNVRIITSHGLQLWCKFNSLHPGPSCRTLVGLISAHYNPICEMVLWRSGAYVVVVVPVWAFVNLFCRSSTLVVSQLLEPIWAFMGLFICGSSTLVVSHLLIRLRLLFSSFATNPG